MKYQSALLALALPNLALAFPFLGGSQEDVLRALEAQKRAEAEPEKRDIISTLTGTVAALLNSVDGLLG